MKLLVQDSVLCILKCIFKSSVTNSNHSYILVHFLLFFHFKIAEMKNKTIYLN